MYIGYLPSKYQLLPGFGPFYNVMALPILFEKLTLEHILNSLRYIVLYQKSLDLLRFILFFHISSLSSVVISC